MTPNTSSLTRAMGRLILAWLMAVSLCAVASPADPKSLDDINVARTIWASLTKAQAQSTSDAQALAQAKPWVARTLLLLGYSNLSTERLRAILSWAHPTDPQFAPGIIPQGEPTKLGTEPLSQAYVDGRLEDWRLWPDGTMTLEVTWLPVADKRQPYFVELQRYRRVGERWLLFSQERKAKPGCAKAPDCPQHHS